MKYLIMVLGLALALPAAADVKVSVRIGDPLFFGRIDVNGLPPPPLLLPRPVIIEPPSVDVELEPLYLHVRPEESRDWRRYCHFYNACGRRVYFVQDRWYRNTYVPHYRSHREDYERREHEWYEHEQHEHGWYDRDRDRDRWQHHDEHHDRRPLPPPPPPHRDDHDQRDHHDDHRDDHRDDHDQHDHDRGHHDRGHDHDERDHDRDHH